MLRKNHVKKDVKMTLQKRRFLGHKIPRIYLRIYPRNTYVFTLQKAVQTEVRTLTNVDIKPFIHSLYTYAYTHANIYGLGYIQTA